MKLTKLIDKLLEIRKNFDIQDIDVCIAFEMPNGFVTSQENFVVDTWSDGPNEPPQYISLISGKDQGIK